MESFLTKNGSSSRASSHAILKRESRTRASGVSAALFVATSFLCSTSPAVADSPVNFSKCSNSSINPDERIAACSEIIRSGRAVGRNLAVTYFNRGAGQATKGELNLALADASEAIRIDPTYAAAYNARGFVYAQRCHLDKGLADFDRALELNSNFVPAFNNRALIFLGKRDTKRAIIEATTAIQIAPAYPLAYATRAAAYISAHKLEDASADIHEAIKLGPKLAAGYHARGLLHIVKNELNLGISELDRAISLMPKHSGAYASRGWAFRLKNELDRALADYNRAIALNPTCPGPYNGRAHVFALKGELQSALGDANEAIRLNSKHAGALATRGSIYRKMGNFPLAQRDLTEALRLDTNLAEAFIERGLLQERLGDLSSARADFQSALAVPLHPVHQGFHDVARKRIAELATPSLQKNLKNAPQPVAVPAPVPPIVISTPPAQLSSSASKQAQTALQPAIAAVRPLKETLAACTKEAQNVGAFTLPGSNGDITLDRCYRGPDHLNCAANALAVEARAIRQEYKIVADTKYADVSNIEAICKIEPGTLADHLKRSQAFEGRWEILNAEYSQLAHCSNLVQESIRNVVLPDLQRGGDIMNSMIERIRGSVNRLSESQKEVSALAGQISDAKKALVTFQKIRVSICVKKGN